MYIRRHVELMEGYVPGEQPSAPGIIKLNTNENPYPPSPAVERVLQNFEYGDLQRYPDPSCIQLRKTLSELLGVQPEQLLMGNGSDEILTLLIRALVENDQGIGYFQPSYSLYPVLAHIQNCHVETVPLIDGMHWTMPKLSSRTAVFFMTHPNAPTGMQYSKADIESFCDTFNGIVVVDEAYVDFAAWNCLDLIETRENVIIVRTLSKSYSLAGIRLGYAVGPSPLIKALYKIKDSYNVNMLTQLTGIAALSDQVHMKQNCTRIIATRERVKRALEDRGFAVAPSATNFLWVQHTSFRARDLFIFLKEAGIYIRHFDTPGLEQHLRITMGTDRQMDTFLQQLDTFFKNR